MAFLYCHNCNSVFLEKLLTSYKGELICPNVKCENEPIVEIDEDLFDLIPRLTDVGLNIKLLEIDDKLRLIIKIGNLYDFGSEDPSAFVSFIDKNKELLENLHSICSNLATKFETVDITEISEKEDGFNFTIFLNKAFKDEDEDEILNYNSYRSTFIEYMYELLEILEKQLNEEKS